VPCWKARLTAGLDASVDLVRLMKRKSASLQRAGAEPTWANAQAMNAFMQADAGKWKKVAAYAKIALD